MNEDLIERFKRGNGGKGHTTRAEVLILPQKLNNKVRQYYEPVEKPLAAGPWLNRPEIPTSAEILDIENVNSSSSDIVEIVPNRTIGGWESKSEPLHHTATSSRTFD
jgi:helicase required for RNAi-mediated heterochromatin assembly 1